MPVGGFVSNAVGMAIESHVSSLSLQSSRQPKRAIECRATVRKKKTPTKASCRAFDGEGRITENGLEPALILVVSRPWCPVANALKAALGRIQGHSSILAFVTQTKKPALGGLYFVWRRRRDSNPRYAINVYSLSRGAPSATRPLLQILPTSFPFNWALALPGSALLGALHLALRVAVVPQALFRSLCLLGQPLGHLSKRR